MIHFRFTSLNFSLYAAYLISRSPARPAPISSESMSGTLLTLRSSMFCYSFRKYKYRSVPRRYFGAALHNAIHDERGRKQNRYRRRNKHSSQRLSHKHSPFKCVQKLFCAKSPGIINIANMVFVFRHSKRKAALRRPCAGVSGSLDTCLVLEVLHILLCSIYLLLLCLFRLIHIALAHLVKDAVMV